MRNCSIYSLFLTLLVILCNDARAEQTTQRPRHTIGVNGGYGRPTLPERYTYNATFMQIQYSYAFKRVRSWDFEVVVMPQYNLTQLTLDKEMTRRGTGYEVGFTAGVTFRTNLWDDRLNFYFMAFLGPMYIPECPARQSSGLNFSDNLAVGVGVKLFGNLYLDLRPGFRHVSNASIKLPNAGLNMWWMTAGIHYRF